jgi:hypothetical protein
MWAWLEGLSGGAANFVGSLTGSLVGLLAILAGAMVNAHLNRRRDDALREPDRQAIKAALKAELDGMNEILLKNASTLDAQTNDFRAPDLAQYVRTMPATLQKIGLLDVETIKSVMAAYSVIDQYCETLLRLGGRFDKQMPEHRRIIIMPKESAKKVADANRQTSNYLEEAIKRLDC